MTKPDFVHSFPFMWQHAWEYEENHSVQSGIHVEIDFILQSLQHRPMWKIRKSSTLKKGLRAIISFLWGLNCGFPTKDVINFVIWEYRGCPSSNKTGDKK